MADSTVEKHRCREVKLYWDHVDQADHGVNLDVLMGKSGAPAPRESH